MEASIEPVVFSSSQSPPSAAFPVKSVDAATSAPVISLRRFTKFSPISPAATSHPYSKISASSVSTLRHCCIWLLKLSKLSPFRMSEPSWTLPALPCEIIWTAATFCLLASVSVICSMPLRLASNMTISACGSAPPSSV